MARHPLSITTSDDGILYDNLLNVHSEVPPKRFWGYERRPGPQYVRGIIEGNGNPPGNDMWVVYSVSKEDIWISRIPVPVKGEVNEPVSDNFNEMALGGVVQDWNIYAPRWCPVGIHKSPNSPENVLMLKDFDPYDYAKAVRVFQKSENTNIQFDLYIEANPEILAIEIVSANGGRCIQTELDVNGNLLVKNGTESLSKISSIELDKWVTVEIDVNAQQNQYNIQLNGVSIAENYQFAVDGFPERIVFRTGKYRLTDDVIEHKSGDENVPGWDEPGADEYAPKAIYYLKDFKAVNK
jgi:hypothetical protein